MAATVASAGHYAARTRSDPKGLICANLLGGFLQIPPGGASKNRTYDLVIISDAL